MSLLAGTALIGLAWTGYNIVKTVTQDNGECELCAAPTKGAGGRTSVPDGYTNAGAKVCSACMLKQRPTDD